MKKGLNGKTIGICLLIGVGYSWISTGYMCWIYRMLDDFHAETVELFTNVIDYIFQAIGIILISVYTHKKGFNIKKIFTISVILEQIFMAAAILVPVPSLSVLFGIIMDLFCGMLIGCFLCYLTVLKKYKSIVFGIGWSIGSISTWLTSIPMDGEFLKSRISLVLYVVLAVISLLIIHFPLDNIEREYEQTKSPGLSMKMIALSMLTVILLEITRNMGFLYPVSDLAEGTVDMEYSRAFYVIGLIIAGIVCDKTRQGGLLLCVCTLICPFISLFLKNLPIGNIVLWALNYAVTGFITVYGVTLFSDFAGELLYLAGFGILCRRIGEPAGALLGKMMADTPVILIIFISIFFFTSVLCAALLWKNLYLPQLTAENKDGSLSEEERLASFAGEMGFSARETEVFREVLKGSSNSRVAGDLFITENTVKFHMKNILKKTGAANRAELTKMFNDRK